MWSHQPHTRTAVVPERAITTINTGVDRLPQPLVTTRVLKHVDHLSRQLLQKCRAGTRVGRLGDGDIDVQERVIEGPLVQILKQVCSFVHTQILILLGVLIRAMCTLIRVACTLIRVMCSK